MKPGSPSFCLRCLLLTSALCPALIAWATSQTFGAFLTKTYRVDLRWAPFRIEPGKGRTAVVDLRWLGLRETADGNGHETRSNVSLEEDGRPLRPHSLHTDIAEKPGLFSHWGDTVLFSPWSDKPPSSSRDRFEVVVPYDPILTLPLLTQTVEVPTRRMGPSTGGDGDLRYEVFEIDLGNADLPIVPWRGKGYIVNLASLDMADQSDSPHAGRSRLMLFQKGQPLTPHALHADIQAAAGLYSHWSDTLYFSPKYIEKDGSPTKPLTARFERVRSSAAALPEILQRRARFISCVTRKVYFGTSQVARSGPVLACEADGRPLRLVADASGLRDPPPPYYAGAYFVDHDSIAIAVVDPGRRRPPISVTYATTMPHRRFAAIGGLDRASISYLLLLAGALLDVVALCQLRRSTGTVLPSWVHVSSIASLALSCAIVMAPGWNSWILTPDSSSYLPHNLGVWASLQAVVSPTAPGFGRSRPPGYLWFIRLVSDQTSEDDARVSQFERGVLYSDRADSEFAKIVRAQKIVLVGSLAVLAACLGRLLFPPLVCLFAYWLMSADLVTEQIDSVMSEPLTTAFLLLLVAVFASFLASGRRLHIVMAGLIAGSMFLIRPAAAFSAALLAVLFAVALLRNWRTYAPSVCASALAGMVGLLPAIGLYRATGELILTPLVSWSKIAFALQVAQPADVEAMPDKESRDYLKAALAKKLDADAAILSETGPGLPAYQFLASNLYKVAHPAAREVLNLPNDPWKRNLIVRHLFMQVSRPILQAHPDEYRKIVMESLRTAITVSSRFSTYVSIWTLLVIVLVLSLALRDWTAVFAGGLVGTHILNVFLTCRYDAPLDRYVHLTEWLLALSLFALGTAALQRGVTHLPARRKSESGLVHDRGDTEPL